MVCLQISDVAQLIKQITMITEEMKQYAERLAMNYINCTKKVLTAEEAARYMGISMSHLYKLTMRMEIPCSKPFGKMLYFDREDLELWLMSAKHSSNSQISQQAQYYCMKKGGRQ